MKLADRLEAYLERHQHHVAGIVMAAILIAVAASASGILAHLAEMREALPPTQFVRITADCPAHSPGEVYLITATPGHPPICQVFTGRSPLTFLQATP